MSVFFPLENAGNLDVSNFLKSQTSLAAYISVQVLPAPISASAILALIFLARLVSRSFRVWHFSMYKICLSL